MTYVLFIIPILLLAFIFRRAVQKSSISFDERQLSNRGKAYQNAFFVMMITNIIGFVLTVVDETNLVYAPVLMALSLFLGLIAFSIQTILSDSFKGTQNQTSYLVLSILCVLCNSIGLIGIPLNEILFSVRVLNLFCALLFLIITILLVYKRMEERNE